MLIDVIRMLENGYISILVSLALLGSEIRARAPRARANRQLTNGFLGGGWGALSLPAVSEVHFPALPVSRTDISRFAARPVCTVVLWLAIAPVDTPGSSSTPGGGKVFVLYGFTMK